MAAPVQQGSPCFTDADCVVSGGAQPKCQVNGPERTVGTCVDPHFKPAPTATATADATAAGGSATGVDMQTIITPIAAVLGSVLILGGLIWIARLRGIWPFKYLNREQDDFEDEVDAPTTLREAKINQKIDFRRSTLVPVEMASPLYQLGFDHVEPVPTADRSRNSLYSGPAGSRTSVLTALPPQELLPPPLPTSSGARSALSTSSDRLSSASPETRSHARAARSGSGGSTSDRGSKR